MPPPELATQPTRTSPLGWAMLVCSSLAMFGNYYVYDAVAPLADLLSSELGLSDTQIGALNAIYSLPNIAMVLIGGLIVDRIGASRAVALFAGICLLGSAIGALSPSFPTLVTGRLLFGLGSESMIVGVTTALGQWFKSQRLGLMLGLNLSIARAGSYAADLSPTWAKPAYDSGVQSALTLAAGFALISFVAALATYAIERAAARRGLRPEKTQSERFVWRDVLRFDRPYWYLVGLCFAIYSVLFPFRSTFAIKYFQDAHGMTREAAGELNGSIFLAAIIATPIFGWLFDRAGRRTWALTFGSLMLVPVFPMLAWTDLDPMVSNVLLGLTFSLVPAVLWPCVAQLAPGARLGTAYGLMTMIQNVGLMGFNLLAGALNDANDAGSSHPQGYTPMLVLFAVLSVGAVLFAALLQRHATKTRMQTL